MKVLIDECCPKKLKGQLTLPDIECKTVREIGYAGKKNGELISLIDGIYDVLVTLDGSIKDQHNIKGRRLSILRIRAKSSDSRASFRLFLKSSSPYEISSPENSGR